MQNDEFCMFCHYRNKRLGACAHRAARPDAAPDAAAGRVTPVPSAIAARAQVQPPRPKQAR